MRALVVDRPGEWAVRDVPPPAIGARDVLVAPRSTGICGSDLHIIAGEFPPTPFPIIPGHEFSGIVREVGAEVVHLKPGDRVAVDPSLFCGECRYCLAGRGNLCARWGAIGDTVDGAFAELVRVPQANAHAMPDDLSFAAGALVEPLSCVVHGLHRLSLRAGSELLIVGGGAIGSMLLQAARVSGAAAVDVVDLEEGRRAGALRLGARAVARSVGELVARRGFGYEYVIEATGVAAAAEAALGGLDRGGTLQVFGVSAEDARVALSPFRVYNDELTILGTMAVLNSFAPALLVMASGAIDLDAMVTHEFPLEEFDEALAAVRERRGLKVQITFA